jgi:hypothetical protein
MSDSDPADYGQHDEKAEASAESQLADATEEADLKWLMADPRGRRIVRRLLERSGVFRTSFTGDALGTAFREGERNAGLRLFDQIARFSPERLASMMNGKDGYEHRRSDD